MSADVRAQEGADYVAVPTGIFTASGVWYRTTPEELERFAGDVLEDVPLPQLLRLSDAWLQAAKTVVLWLLPALLMLVPPLNAALVALVLYVGWQVLGPAWVSVPLARGLLLLQSVVLIGIYSAVVLSMLGMRGAEAAAVTGLVGFIALRWGVVDWLVRPVVDRARASLYRLPVPDQVLRAFLHRFALRLGVVVPEIERMERDLHDAVIRRNSRKS